MAIPASIHLAPSIRHSPPYAPQAPPSPIPLPARTRAALGRHSCLNLPALCPFAAPGASTLEPRPRAAAPQPASGSSAVPSQCGLGRRWGEGGNTPPSSGPPTKALGFESAVSLAPGPLAAGWAAKHEMLARIALPGRCSRLLPLSGSQGEIQDARLDGGVVPNAPFVCLQVSSVFWSLYFVLRTSPPSDMPFSPFTSQLSSRRLPIWRNARL